MRLYNHEPLKLVRVHIVHQGYPTEYFTLIDTDQESFKKWFMQIVEQEVKVSPFDDVNKRLTKVFIREATGAKNGKTISASFRGLTPEQTMELIKKNMK